MVKASDIGLKRLYDNRKFFRVLDLINGTLEFGEKIDTGYAPAATDMRSLVKLPENS